MRATGPSTFMRSPENRRRLLMLVHCVPQPDGDPQQILAWQLLLAVTATHRVWLAGIAGGTINLKQ